MLVFASFPTDETLPAVTVTPRSWSVKFSLLELVFKLVRISSHCMLVPKDKSSLHALRVPLGAVSLKAKKKVWKVRTFKLKDLYWADFQNNAVLYFHHGQGIGLEQ